MNFHHARNALRHLISTFALALLTTIGEAGAEPRMEFKPYVAPKDTSISGLTTDAVRALWLPEWEKLDRNTGVRNRFMGVETILQWYEKISLPFPDTWPPVETISYSYYGYAEYRELLQHGPSLYVSAPLARVKYKNGNALEMEMISESIGLPVSGRHSQMWAREQADHYRAVQANQPTLISTLLTWYEKQEEAEKSTLPIRKLYCQWTFDHKTLVYKYIQINHQAFFDWLSCEKLSRKDIGYLDFRPN